MKRSTCYPSSRCTSRIRNPIVRDAFTKILLARRIPKYPRPSCVALRSALSTSRTSPAAL
eukprot:1675724-Rhodomonas_salina.2